VNTPPTLDQTGPVQRQEDLPAMAELRRVLASKTFARATRLCALLNYVVEQSLANRADELTEQQIGIHVFGRSAGFNSAEDTIVRGTARLLRQRLEAYYHEEGWSDPIRISIPKGSYVARFDDISHPLQSKTVSPPEPGAAVAVAQEIAPAQAGWPRAAKLWLAGLTLCIAVLATLLAIRPSKAAAPPLASEPQALWNVLFTPGRKTLIVPGDASLDAFEAWEQRPVSLEEYSNQSYLAKSRLSVPPGSNDVPLAVRSVTPMADLRLVSELVRVPEHMGRPELQPWVEIRYARDVVVGDTHENNLILIGSETFNPWVSLYRNNMDFYAQHDVKTDVFTILNRAPRAGEEPIYRYDRSPDTDTYTHVALLENAQGSGKVLAIEGTSMGTTYAALTFFTQEQLWRPVIEAATDQRGRLHNFEVLLSSRFVRGGLTNTRCVALHVH
jgi:hypothetical protein